MPSPAALHFGFETLGYLAGAVVYTILRQRRGDVIPDPARLNVLVGAAVGAAIGSRLLAWLCDPSFSHSLLAGKTIVGGLLGGWLGVELAKKLTGIRQRTGDLFVLPLITAMAIGRIGCFLTGPFDRTVGLPSELPWAIAMGDDVPRHPVALYEIAFLIALGFLTTKFRVFLPSYLAFRFFVDFLKPDPPPLFASLTAIQLACLAGMAWYAWAYAMETGNRQPETA